MARTRSELLRAAATLVAVIAAGGCAATDGARDGAAAGRGSTEKQDERSGEGGGSQIATTESPRTLPTPRCDEIFEAAAQIDDMRDQSSDLDAGLTDCESPEDWASAAKAHPDALDGADAARYLANRCQVRSNRNAPLCGHTPP